MQIATWNVNSIRTRIAQVQQWLTDRPEVSLLCLQETKVIDADFPSTPFTEMGWQVYCYGQKSYNGVAMLTRSPLTDVKLGFGALLSHASEWDSQKRVMAACYDDIVVVNLYVPNGSTVNSDKYFYKLAWLEILYEYLSVLQQHHPHILLCGDFNVALQDIDIHDPTDRSLHIMATEPERSAINQILSLGFTDIFRQFHPEGGQFSWWDYRAAAFRRNLGWRIDYHFAAQSLCDRVVDCWIDVTPRQWTQPSDHAPVVIGFTKK